jgi:predicted acylesterase/phospholipase RssA
VAKKIQQALSPRWSDERREKLHEADIDTTWFGVAREGGELPLFRDYGRYAALMKEMKEIRLEITATLSASSDRSETIYPSLVAFVGETGAGKSTLIKLLIDLKTFEEEWQASKFPTPVVGAAGRDLATSEDVHLYLDPDSSQSQAPLLFADCEGLDGGEREPIGARLKRKIEKEAKIAAAQGIRRRQRLKHISERELTWADSQQKQSREFAVAHLYPRLLYTFSDVIVFVLKNPRVIEKVLERLVDWAQAALEKSSNQPVLPHAIIALNASENDIEGDLWNVDIATKSLLENLSRTVHQNATFRKYAEFWRKRNRKIETVEELLLSYYSSFRVVRVPADGRPKLMSSQVEKLSDMISSASKKARDRKAELHMLLDAEDFQPYLQFAFDHFAENLDRPFDFVQASFTKSPIPNDFGGNILKLAIQVMESWKNHAPGTTIFEELSYIVASCIMLNAARDGVRGTDEQIFPMYLEHLDNALENFCDRHWPCEFSDPRGGRCVNVRSGHGAKGHQSDSGKLLAAGDYTSNFSFQTYQRTFNENTYERLRALRQRVKARSEDAATEEHAAAEVHRDFVLPLFFRHASRENTESFASHTVCYCCLFEPPEHALPCGHIICTRCLKTFGRQHLRGYVEISECPLEPKEQRFRRVWQVYLKPPSCGVRVLCLDGGGIRGIVELETLRLIEKELGGRVHIQSFFDLIVGTSTGGIIALGLTARNFTLDECIRRFESLCDKAFTRRKGMGIPGVRVIVSNFNHSRYETQPLEEALTSVFTADQYLFGGRREDFESMIVKVAVTTTDVNANPVVLANYNRLGSDKPPAFSYSFQRPNKLTGELKTWQAARATSAAPTYFKPFHHEVSKQTYSDGGICHNNPVAIAEDERKLIWPAQQDEEPDIVVSIGTMHCPKEKDNPARRIAPSGVIAHGTSNLSSTPQNTSFAYSRPICGYERTRLIRGDLQGDSCGVWRRLICAPPSTLKARGTNSSKQDHHPVRIGEDTFD